MNEDQPKRWLDADGGSTDVERELLGSAGGVEPPATARESVWVALARRISPGGEPGSGAADPAAHEGGGARGAENGGAGGAGAAKSVGTGGVVVKVGAAAIVGGAILFVATRAMWTGPSGPSLAPSMTVTSAAAPPEPPLSPRPATSAAPPDAISSAISTETAGNSPQPTAFPSEQPQVASPRANAPARRLVRQEREGEEDRHAHDATHGASSTAPERSAEPPPLVATTPASAAPPGSSSAKTDSPTFNALRDESVLLGRARAALRGGNAHAALAMLEMARSRHPQGVLLREREVLTIEALSHSGQIAAASTRAQRFLQTFPSSPHAAHVQTFVR